MAPTAPRHPAPRATGPDPSPTAAAIARQEADAWRHLAHALSVEVRRRLIPLVRANLIPLDVACRVLEDAGLPPLPRR